MKKLCKTFNFFLEDIIQDENLKEELGDNFIRLIEKIPEQLKEVAKDSGIKSEFEKIFLETINENFKEKEIEFKIENGELATVRDKDNNASKNIQEKFKKYFKNESNSNENGPKPKM